MLLAGGLGVGECGVFGLFRMVNLGFSVVGFCLVHDLVIMSCLLLLNLVIALTFDLFRAVAGVGACLRILVGVLLGWVRCVW